MSKYEKDYTIKSATIDYVMKLPERKCKCLKCNKEVTLPKGFFLCEPCRKINQTESEELI